MSGNIGTWFDPQDETTDVWGLEGHGNPSDTEDVKEMEGDEREHVRQRTVMGELLKLVGNEGSLPNRYITGVPSIRNRQANIVQKHWHIHTQVLVFDRTS